MLDDYGFEIYEENEFPLAYLLTFRTFGSWLHGDEQESVGRDGRNHYGKPRIQPKPEFKAAMKVARLHQKISNIRGDFIHKSTTQIVKKFGIVCLENLNVSGMLKNHKLARSISDVS